MATKGFTIVELLIVVVVIAILAAITVVAYTGVQNRAHDASVQTDLKNIGTQVELYRVTNGDLPRNADFQNLKTPVSRASYASTITTNATFNFVYCSPPNTTNFVLVTKSKSGNTFRYGTPGAGAVDLGTTSSSTIAICTGAGVTTVDTTANSRLILSNNDVWYSWVE